MKNTFICYYRWGMYFRVLGRGLSIQRDLPVLFSERNGYRKVVRIGRWALEVLR